MKLKEAINDYTRWKAPQVKGNTVYGYHWQLVGFAVFVRNKHLEDVTEREVVDYVNLSMEFGHRPSTMEKQTLAIRQLLTYWQDRGLKVMKPSLVPMIKSQRPMPRVANDSDYYRLINIIPASGYNHIRNRAIISLLHDSGARLNEILQCNLQDLDLPKRTITIHTEKHFENSPYRNIFFREETAAYLKTWLAKRRELLEHLTLYDKEALFLSIMGGACGEGTEARRFSIDAAGECLRKYSKLAGLKSTFNAHSLRHRFGRVLAEKEVDDLLISQFMGHNSVDSSRIYTELFGPALKRIYDRVIGR